MSTLNAHSISVSEVVSTNIRVGTTSANLTLASNSTAIVIGSNLVIKSGELSVGNSTVNSVVNSTHFSTQTISFNGVPYDSTTANSVNCQIFTSNGTWTMPGWANGDELVQIEMWGGGGGGASGYGGGGGACVTATTFTSIIGGTLNVVVGTGGTSGNPGTPSYLDGTSIYAYGGGGASSTRGGGGGGSFSDGSSTVGGEPLGGGAGVSSTHGGGGGANSTVTTGGSSVYGGGAGSSTGAGGASVYGGAGGSATGARGISSLGGNGGNNTVAASAPGGGGGGSANFSGARGEVRIWTFRGQ